jgi:hypothetical protein
MAKALKTAVVAAIAIYIPAAALKLGAQFSVTLFGSTLTGATALAVTTFATTLVSAGIGMLTSKGIEAGTANFGSKFASRSSSAPRQIIYGKTRVGGTILHLETTGTDNFLLHMVVAVAGHEVEAIETVRINDKDLTTTTSTISGSTVHTVTNADFTNTDNDNNFGSGRLVRFTKVLGTDTQSVDGFLDAQLSSIGTNHRFRGIAYVYIQMVFDAEKFGGGLPAVSFIVKGKKVYDPRNSTTAWSDNPALCIRDYLMDTRYGLKATSAEINDSTSAGGFASAANICDQTVTLADSSTETRYTANGFTNMSANGEGIIEALLSSCAGKMSYTNGKFNLFAGAAQTPSLTITDDDLLQPVAISTKPQSGDMYNTVKGIYVDASSDYQGTESPVYQDSTFLAADTPTSESSANYVKTLEVQFPFTTSETMAQRLQRIALNGNRQTTQINLLTTTKFMRLQPNDWVYVTNDRLSYSNKVFEVVSMNLEVVGDDVPTVATRLVLKEIASSIFTFASNAYETGVSEGSTVSTGTYAITAPSSLSATVTTNNSFTINSKNVTLSWTNNTNQVVNGTEVQYKLSSDSTYIDAGIVGRDITKFTLTGLEVAKTYNIRIRHISTFNTYSAFATVNASTGGTAFTNIEDGATAGARVGTNLKAVDGVTNLGAVDVINSQLSLGVSGTTLILNNGGGNTTLGEDNVGFPSGSINKLGGIAAGADVTANNTANDTSNVNGTAASTVKNNAAVGNTSATNFNSFLTDVASTSGSTAIAGNNIKSGSIDGSLISVDNLNLKTQGTSASGTSKSWGSSASDVFIADIGTAAGFYQGFVSLDLTSGSSMAGGQISVRIKEGSTTKADYRFPFTQEFDGGDGLETSDQGELQVSFGYFYSGTSTLSLYVRGDSNGSSSTATVKARVVKFGAEQPNTFTFTDVTGASTGSTNTSNTVTLSGFTGTLVAQLSGHSSATFKVNSGSYTSADKNVTSGDTVNVRLTASANSGTTRSATLVLSGVGDTYSVTTSGTYTPDSGDTFGCFAKNTPIWMSDHSFKNIQDIKVGDVVKSFNIAEGMVENKEVTEVMEMRRDVIYHVKHNKGTLRITDGHPVYVDGKGWCAIDSVKATDIHKTPSQDLLVGDMLKTALGSSEIKSIEKQEEQDVYNINRVADNHNFYAGQVLVHNVELK